MLRKGGVNVREGVIPPVSKDFRKPITPGAPAAPPPATGLVDTVSDNNNDNKVEVVIVR